VVCDTQGNTNIALLDESGIESIQESDELKFFEELFIYKFITLS